MKKRVRLAMLSVASLACMLAIPAMGAAPSGSKTWSGNVDFWVSKVGQAVKDNSSNTTYMNFTGAPTKDIYVWLTEKTADKNAYTVSKKTKIEFGKEKNNPTGAIKNQKVDLTAAREYILDEKVALSGKWKP